MGREVSFNWIKYSSVGCPMTAACYQLVYVSRVAVPLEESDLRALCEACLRNNRRDSITGLLAFDGQRFLQAIEGSERAINMLMAKIRQDRRHDSIDVFSRKFVASREFGGWSMNFEQPARAPGGRDFQARLMLDVAQVTDPSLQAAFIGFARLSEHSPATFRETIAPRQVTDG